LGDLQDSPVAVVGLLTAAQYPVQVGEAVQREQFAAAVADGAVRRSAARSSSWARVVA
jgi:hypothetical protein